MDTAYRKKNYISQYDIHNWVLIYQPNLLLTPRFPHTLNALGTTNTDSQLYTELHPSMHLFVQFYLECAFYSASRAHSKVPCDKPSLTLEEWFSTGTILFPTPDPGEHSDNFGCHVYVCVWGGVLLESSGQRPGMLLNTLQ